jgi:peptidoglycan-N-acetylmuramic acid deacetylase
VAGIAGYAGRNHLPTWKESSADKTSYGNNITQTTDLKSSTTQNSYGNKKYTAPTPKNEDVQKTTTTGNLPDKKYGWGIKKKGNHQQPEVPAGICDTLALYDAYWIGDPKEKAVYLTFDEGYENGYTSKI